MCTHKCKVRAQTDTITLKGGVNMKRDKHLGIRMDSQLHKKLVYIAEYEGRSLNWQVIHLIQRPVNKAGIEAVYQGLIAGNQFQRAALSDSDILQQL